MDKNPTMTVFEYGHRPSDGRVLVSFSRQMAEGFRSERILFDKIEGLVRFRGHYSPTAFRDGYRDGQHALPGQELMILDFDGGYTIAEAMLEFERYVGVIATTRNHMLPKNGKVAERFRLLLPTDMPIMLGKKEFKLMMTEVIRRFPHADPVCVNIDRMYYGHPDAEVFFLDGEQLFCWETYYLVAMERLREKNYAHETSLFRNPTPSDGRQHGSELYFKMHFTPGARNQTLFRVAHWMKEDGLVNAADRIRRMNEESECPLDHGEMEGILSRVL